MKIALMMMAVGILAAGSSHGKPDAPETMASVRAKLAAIPLSEKVNLTPDEWRLILTPEQFHVMRERGTERPFSGKCLNIHQPGTFVCAACGNPLFDAEAKFDSGTGWPSFTQAADADRIKIVPESSIGVVRDEVTCARCGSHLGHVFKDGPPPTGLRYCMNAVALKLLPKL